MAKAMPDGNRSFDPTREDHVLVHGDKFCFEPYGAEFAAPSPGAVVIGFGRTPDRHRGVEISANEDALVVQVPAGGQTWWLPDAVGPDQANRPWELRLWPLDHERGTLT